MSSMFLLALVLLPASSVSAQQVSDRDRFNLFTGCAEVNPILVRRASAWWDEVGLTEDAVHRTVNSRLRAARLYDELALSPMLLVDVFVVPDRAVGVTVSLSKILLDEDSGIRRPQTTWEHDHVVEADTHHATIIATLSEAMDSFIDEYLRVNAEACAQRHAIFR